MPVGSDPGNGESLMESNGRRLFSALKELQRRIMGFHPAAEIRPSEFMMLHSMLGPAAGRGGSCDGRL